MPTIIETKVYTLDELNDAAKDKAREWYREACQCDDWAEYVIDDAKECGSLIGIEVDQIYYSGFSSQGDGACFGGSYSYRKGGAKAIREHAPEDKQLHAIADTLQAIQAGRFYGLEARVKHSGHYYHEFCTVIDVYGRDGCSVDEDTDEAISDALHDFMRWIYRRLESEYEWLNANEQVDENIIANGYTFTAGGRRFG